MKVQSLVSEFVGFGGQSVWLGEGDEYEHDAPIVVANPDRFTAPQKPEPPKRGTGLRRG